MTMQTDARIITAEDQAVIDSYLKDIQAPINYQKSLAVRYGVGTGLFLIAAFWFDTVWLAVPIYLVFIIWLVLRHRAFARRSRGLHRIFKHFEAERQRSGGGSD